MTDPLRDHGYGDSPEVGPPSLVTGEPLDEECPHCEGKTLFQLQCHVRNPSPMLKVPPGTTVMGTYVGCAACPYASAMMTTAVSQ